MSALAQEIRHAARRLVRSPSFTIASVLTLALAIGANAAIFTVVYRVVLNPLPYDDSDRLIALDVGMPKRNIPRGINSLTTQLYYQYLDRARTLDRIALYNIDELTLTGQGTPERIRIARTTASLVPLLRVKLAQGRWFSEQEEAPGAEPVAVLSHGLWSRRFGEDPTLVGRMLALNGVLTRVIGIGSSSFGFPDSKVDLWTPLTLSRNTATNAYNYPGIARLRDGATMDTARTEMTRLTNELHATNPGNGYDFLVSTATTLIEMTVGRVSRALWILLASVGVVLLVACANVANLFLVRSETRQRDVAVRRALGASGRAMTRYFLSESVLLAVAGGAIGLGLAWGAITLLVAYGPTNLPRLEDVRLDWIAVAFTLVLSVLAAVAFGSIPLTRLRAMAASLHETGRGNTASRNRHRTRHLLMGGQVALALVLLVSSGLMLGSFQKLRAIDPGFDGSSALTFRIGLPKADYPDRTRMIAAHRAIVDRLSALPGVTSVSATTCLPLSGRGYCFGMPVTVEGRVAQPGTIPPIVAVRAVAADYMETTGMRLLRGRRIEHADIDHNEPSVVVNQAFVDVYLPKQDPLGRRLSLGTPAFLKNGSISRTIVGVVANTPTVALAESPRVPKLYMPMLSNDDGKFEAGAAFRRPNEQAAMRPNGQQPPPFVMGPAIDAMSYVVRVSTTPTSILGDVRRAVAGVDGNLALAQVRPLQDLLDAAAAQTAFTMVLLVIASVVALLLGIVGIYGVMSYIVSQRTSEIGVRLALGAAPSSVAAMIARQGGLVALLGVIAGLATALAGTRLIESLLYGVSPRDPGVFAATASLLVALAFVACWLPARRAARLSPLEALRTE
jgi:putative ABC transport system permease protein